MSIQGPCMDTTSVLETEPSPARPRAFNLGDAMIFIAASAAALSYVASAAEQRFMLSRWNPGYSIWAGLGIDQGLRGFLHTLWLDLRNRQGLNYLVVSFAAQMFSITLGCWSLALPIVRLRKPRPPAVEALMQPGAIVGVAVAVGLWARLTLEWAYVEIAQQLGESIWGVGVALAWSFLVASRKWRAEASWMDRLGRAMGACWMASIPLFWWLA